MSATPASGPRDTGGADPVVCADVGSTYTKVAMVDLATGTLLATADHPTTLDGDVLDGVDAAVRTVDGRQPPADSRLRVCSSAGGGLRLAVVGYEPLVTAEAGRRVGLSAGAHVVHVAAGRLDSEAVHRLVADRPDVVLLVGGTDGGDDEVLRHNARQLGTGLATGPAAVPAAVPVVLAGNAAAQDAAADVLRSSGTVVITADNVLPRIGELTPTSARTAIREVFLRHVIGGKRLSRDPRFAGAVRGATPDVVLTAVEHLGGQLGRDVVVVDVGGATTDVYSVLSMDPEGAERGPQPEVAGTLRHSRTVEGDLGVRWGATGIVAAALSERLLDVAEAGRLGEAAQRRAAHPDMVPREPAEAAVDAHLTTLAITVALRRHARGERIGQTTAWRGRKDLSRAALVVGSGGVLRAMASDTATALLRSAVADHAGGWAVPARPDVVVDGRYVLAAAGLLAGDHPAVATRLLRHVLPTTGPTSTGSATE